MNNFPINEFDCPCGLCENKVKDDLISRLQKVRDFLGEPINITSGYRCKTYNTLIGASSTSSHISGLAADIFIPDNFYRYRIIKAVVMTDAFNRYGTGNKKGARIFHVDCDLSKPQKITWGY